MSIDASLWAELFAPLEKSPAWVVGQLGQSVDGRIATESGHSHYINGTDDIERLHRLRALADAVVVGTGTVAADDPRLTVRKCEGENPVRVILDRSGRLDPELTVFQDGAAPTLWVMAAPEDGTRPAGGGRPPVGPGPADGAWPAGGPGRTAPDVEVVHLPAPDGVFDPHSVIHFLAGRGLDRILVEGGGVTVSAFLEAGALDRLHLSVAPLILGSGRPSLTLPPVEMLDEALRPSVRHFTLGSDLLFDLEIVAQPD